MFPFSHTNLRHSLSTPTTNTQDRLHSAPGVAHRPFHLVCDLFFGPASVPAATFEGLKAWFCKGEQQHTTAHRLLATLDPTVAVTYSQLDRRHSLGGNCVYSGVTQRQSWKDLGISRTVSGKDRHRPRTRKCTHCPAKVSLKVIKAEGGRGAVKLVLDNLHNHAVGELFSRTTPCLREDYRQLLISLFAQGVWDKKAHAALKAHQVNLRRQGVKAADIPALPSIQKVIDLQRAYLFDTYGSYNTLEAIEEGNVAGFIEWYNLEKGHLGARAELLPPGFLKERLVVGEVEDSMAAGAGKQKEATTSDLERGFAILLITPLCDRVHRFCAQSGDVVGMDGVHNLCSDRHVETTTLMTKTAAGALPCGYIIHNLSSEVGFREAVLALKHLMPEDAFFCRGPEGALVCVCVCVCDCLCVCMSL